MSTVGLAWAAGMVAGLGVLLLLVAALPDPPPELAAALARLSGPRRDPVGGWEDWAGRVGRWLARHTPSSGVLGVPAADLRLLGQPVERFLTTRATFAVAGLAAGPLAWVLPAAAGLAPPPAASGLLGVSLAAAGWMLPGLRVSRRAATARAEFRRALSAYLDLVALERAGRGSPVQALEAAAGVGHGWVFTRIQRRLAVAARAGTNPYTALAELAEQTGVTELQDLADITAVAADGAAVYGSLLMRARSLRHTVLADERAAANTASERLVVPVALLGTGFLLLLFYPALTRILA